MQERSWFRALQRWRYPLSAIFDAAFWYVALGIAVLARLDFNQGRVDVAGLLQVATLMAAVHVTGGFMSGLYRGKRPIASFSEVRLVFLSTAAAAAAGFFLVVVAGPPNLVPLSSVLAASAYQLLGALGWRYGVRLLMELTGRSRHRREHRLLVFGAGEAGDQITKALIQDPLTDLDPVAFLDDDPTRRRLILHGVRVVGTRYDITAAADDYSADTLLLAIPTAPQEQITEIADIGHAAGLIVKILPSAHALTGSVVVVGDIRNIEMSDFLNRDEVRIDDDSVRGYIQGKSVLVTGAGGSIGSVLCRTLASYGPSRLIMLDHDENALHALTLPDDRIRGLDPDDLVLCDIRDLDAVRTVIDSVHPQVIFHAAAHKHVSLLERYPSEGIKTNVVATLNMLTAAAESGCERFINISTDKAADPINVLGMTKRAAEQLTAYFDSNAWGTYVSVRFGNVLGSKGSIIPTLMAQIRNNQAVTVTDAEATRYFMTAEEAVLLVLQAGALGHGGDVLVLDMGDPVNIDSLARRLCRLVAPTRVPEIVYIGLRPGEKLHEVLVHGDDEPAEWPHERLRRFRVPPLSPDEALSLDPLTHLAGSGQPVVPGAGASVNRGESQ